MYRRHITRSAPATGTTTLEQKFLFRGRPASAEAVGDLLMTAPLVGEDSIFGARPGKEQPNAADGRSLRGFSPAPGFRFDVDLTRQAATTFLVRFSQPDRTTPYLAGELVWLLSDAADGAELDEQINTERAMAIATDSLGGPRPSLRRWLFFRLGHKQVMNGAAANIASLLGS